MINADLSEVLTCLGMYRERKLDNGYRAGVVTEEIRSDGRTFESGQAVIYKHEGNGTYSVGTIPPISGRQTDFIERCSLTAFKGVRGNFQHCVRDAEN